MRTILLIACVALSGCLPREPMTLPSRACPALPLLAERPTTAEYKAWQAEVIALYVQCAKGPR